MTLISVSISTISVEEAHATEDRKRRVNPEKQERQNAASLFRLEKTHARDIRDGWASRGATGASSCPRAQIFSLMPKLDSLWKQSVKQNSRIPEWLNIEYRESYVCESRQPVWIHDIRMRVVVHT